MKNTDEDDDFDFSWAENFSKRMTKFGERMSKFGEKMADMGCKGGSYMFNCFDDDCTLNGDKTSVVTMNGKTTIKKNGKKIVIDKDGNITIDGKKTVPFDDSCYNKTASSCHTKTAAECNAEKTTIKVPADAMVHKDLESDMEVISRGELNRIIHENDIKFTNIYWYIGLGCLMTFGLATWINCLVCKCYFAQ